MRFNSLHLLSSSFLAIASLAHPAAAASGTLPLSIYGSDSRQDLYQVTDSMRRKLADSTVALIKNADVLGSSGGLTRLATSIYGEEQSLCSNERFYPQKTAAFCSGSLVGPDLVLTAGHCITSMSDCRNTKLVFGFAMKSATHDVSKVKASDVYGCASIVSRRYEIIGADFALIKLDRRVPDHRPIPVNRSGSILPGTSLVMIGHPSGLSTKIADGHVIQSSEPGYFDTTLDAFAGNSGSSVFNARTGMIEGILVRGARDFELDRSRSCMRASRYAEDGGNQGEAVTKIGAVAQSIPAISTATGSNGCVEKSYTYEIENISAGGDMPRSVAELPEATQARLKELVRKLSIGIAPESTIVERIAFLEKALAPTHAACRALIAAAAAGDSGGISESWQTLTGAGIQANQSRDSRGEIVPGYRQVSSRKIYLIKSALILK